MDSPLIETIPGVLSEAECAELIERIEASDPRAAPITTASGFEMRPDIRNNDRVLFDDVPLAVELFARIRQAVPPVLREMQVKGLNERFRCYRYQPGQFFAMHRDGAFARSLEERSLITLLVYLNGDCEGGETRFPASDRVVTPAEGMALLFEHHLLHEGAEVRRGLKYVLRTDVMYRRE